MPDTTEPNDRLSRLFVQHNERLVRALRARLGRYHWNLAEDLAAATWLRAVERVDRCPAAGAGAGDEFAWLSLLATAVTITHFCQARRRSEVLTDFSGARAYCLPAYAAEADLAGLMAEALGVAA
jgi:DNA-directed RNA polymerase specialized sigma24 family protein